MESVPKRVETSDEKKERIENSDLLQTRLDFYREQGDALTIIYSSKKMNNPVIQQKADATEKKLTAITLSPDESMQTPDRAKAKERIAAKKAEIKDILDRYLTVESQLNHINQQKENVKKRWQINFKVARDGYQDTPGFKNAPGLDDVTKSKLDALYTSALGTLNKTLDDKALALASSDFTKNPVPESAFEAMEPELVDAYNQYRRESFNIVHEYLAQPENIDHARDYVNTRTANSIEQINKNPKSRLLTPDGYPYYDELIKVYIEPNRNRALALLDKLGTSSTTIQPILEVFDQQLAVATSFLDRFSYSEDPYENRNLVKSFSPEKKAYDKAKKTRLVS